MVCEENACRTFWEVTVQVMASRCGQKHVPALASAEFGAEGVEIAGFDQFSGAASRHYMCPDDPGSQSFTALCIRGSKGYVA